MFNQIYEYFNMKKPDCNLNNAKEFLDYYQGTTFGNGLFTIYKKEDIQKWNDIVSEAFPAVKGCIECFGYNWTGIQFARYLEDENTLIMFDCGTGQPLGIRSDIDGFFAKELINDVQSYLLVDDFYKWKKENQDKTLKYSECVGFKVPMFLGGKNEPSNLELSDMEVYWGICGQLISNL